MSQGIYQVFTLCAVCAIIPAAVLADENSSTIEVPHVEGEWWQIAPNAPDAGRWATGDENACDFAILQSDEGWKDSTRVSIPRRKP